MASAPPPPPPRQPPAPPSPSSPQPGGPGAGRGAVVAVATVALLAAVVVAAVVALGGGDGGGNPVAERTAVEGRKDPSASAGTSAPAGESHPVGDSARAGTAAESSPAPSHEPYVVLDPGECFDHPDLDGSVTTVEPRSCRGPHDGEVITNRSLTGDFEDADALDRRVLALCEADAKKKLATMPADGRHYYFYALYPTLLTYEYQSQDQVSCALTLSTKQGGAKLTEPLP